jgi:hypothetical protein
MREKAVTDGKLYLLAEFLVKPKVLDETKGIFSNLLPKVLEEEGCEAMYTTSINDEPSKLVFFEIFSSQKPTTGISHRPIPTSSRPILKENSLRRQR